MSNFPGVGASGAAGTGSPDTPDDIKQKLESLTKGSRLSADFLDAGGSNKFITASQAAKLATLKNVVELGSDGKLPALDGSKLTNLPIQLTPAQVFNAENRGIYSGTGSLKNLGEGWWYIEGSNTGVTGRPSGSSGDLLVYRRTVGPTGVILLSFGRDKDGPQVWGEYRAADNLGYSPWIKLSVTDTLSLDQIKTELQKEGWGPLNGGGTPVVPLVTYYAGYDTAFPTSLSDLSEHTSTKFTISRSDTTPERIFVLVPKDHASQVSGFIVSSGVEASWSFRDLNIDGKSFRAFYSPGAFYETSDTVEIKYV